MRELYTPLGLKEIGGVKLSEVNKLFIYLPIAKSLQCAYLFGITHKFIYNFSISCISSSNLTGNWTESFTISSFNIIINCERECFDSYICVTFLSWLVPAVFLEVLFSYFQFILCTLNEIKFPSHFFVLNI